MRTGWAAAGALVAGAAMLGGVAAGCEKRRERVKLIEVGPRRDRNVYIGRDRRDDD